MEEEESGEIDCSNDEGISATPSETNDENVAEMHQDDDAPPRQHILVQWVLDSSIERYSIMPNPLMRGANILFDGIISTVKVSMKLIFKTSSNCRVKERVFGIFEKDGWTSYRAS